MEIYDGFAEEEREELKQKTSFFGEWFVFCLLIVGLSLVVIGAVAWYTGLFWLSGLIIVPVAVCVGIIFKNRKIIDQKHAVVYEWCGERVKPLPPGIYFPFPFLGFLSRGVLVKTNETVLNIFTGSREGLKEDMSQYYGNQNDIQPETGASLRLMYDAVIKIVDPNKFVYSFDDAYAQIASLAEKEVVAYAHDHEAEYIYDNFFKEDWNRLLVDKLAKEITRTMGVSLLKFLPKGIIDKPEVEADRLLIEKERRRSEFLNEYEKNQKKEKEIRRNNDEMNANSIKAIQDKTGCTVEEALKYRMSKEKLEVIEKGADKGHLTYVQDSGNGDLSKASALGVVLKGGE